MTHIEHLQVGICNSELPTDSSAALASFTNSTLRTVLTCDDWFNLTCCTFWDQLPQQGVTKKTTREALKSMVFFLPNKKPFST